MTHLAAAPRNLLAVVLGLALALATALAGLWPALAAAEAEPVPLFSFGSLGSGNGQLNNPSDVALDGAGNVYVADALNNRVQKFDADGNFLSKFGSAGSGNGQFSGPTSVDVDGGGNIYVVDSGNNRVQKFGPTGNFLAAFGGLGLGDGQFASINSISVDGAGNSFVTDSFRNDVQKFDSNGVFITKFGGTGSGNGQFNYAQAIALDGAGNSYVTDRTNDNVQKFGPAGNFLMKFGTTGLGDGQFQNALGIALDGAGNIYVTDNSRSLVQKFDPAGNFLSKFDYGANAQQSGIVVSGSGRIYVARLNGDNVRVFGPPPPSISVNDPSIPEGNSGTSQLGFQVSLSAASGQTVTVQAYTTGGTASGGSDFAQILSLAPVTVTFNPGETVKTVNVTVNGDTVVEPNETFFLNLQNPTNASIADNQGTGTIINDDFTLTVNDASVTEGNSGTVNAVFTVTLNPAKPSGNVTVDFATANNSAVAPADYVANSGSLLFLPGETSKTITVLVNGDLVDEPNQQFNVNLSNAAGAAIADGTGVGNIIDDDPLPQISINDMTMTEGNSGTKLFAFNLTLDRPSDNVVSVTVNTANGTATAGSDYAAIVNGPVIFAVGSTSQSISVSVNGDTTFEPDESFFVNLSNSNNATIADGQGQGTIINDDSQPLVAEANGPYAVNEGGSLGLTGSSSGGTAPYTYSWDLDNDGAYDDSTLQNPTFSAATYDGPALRTVGLQVCDGTSQCATDAAGVNVTNVAPAATFNAPASVIETELLQLSLTGGSDPSAADMAAGLQYAFDCGGGYGPLGPGNTATCSPGGPGTLAVKGKVQDKDGGFTEYTANVIVTAQAPPVFPAGLVLPANACVCTPVFMNTNTAATETIFAKVTGSSATLVIYATTVNPTDPERVEYRIVTSAGVTTGFIEYPPPAPPYPLGFEKSSSVNLAGLTPGEVIRIEITTPPPTPSTQPHWRVEGLGVAAFALNTPTFASLEEGRTRWLVSANAGESINLDVFSTGLPTPATKIVNARIFKPSGMLDSTLLNVPLAPGAEINVGPVAPADAGLWVIDVTIDGHHQIDKTSGANRALFLDWRSAGFAKKTVIINKNGTLAAGTSYTVNVFEPVAESGGTQYVQVDSRVTSTGSVVFDKLLSGNYRFVVVSPNGVTTAPPQDDELFCDKEFINTFETQTDVSITINDVSVTEGDSGTTNATFTVTLSAPTGATVTVNFTTVNDTAVAGADYTASTGTLTFSPGETSKNIAVSVIGDLTSEVNETFFVDLSSPTNATLADAQGVGTIIDNDGTPVLSINSVSITEGNSGTASAVFTVTLSNPSASTVTVNFVTTDGTAKVSNSDYVATSGTVTFLPGETAKSITTSVIGDTTVELDETFFVNLTSATNATLSGTAGQGTGTILNDDANTAPVANNSSVSTNLNVSLNGFLSATDADGDALTFSRISNVPAAAGNVFFAPPNTNQFTYTPALNFSGVTSFTFKANDGTVDSNTATVTITVTDPQTASISNFVWRDTNGNGIQDAGEPGVAGVTVGLYKDDGGGVFYVAVGSQVTDATGNYAFTGLAADSYKLKFTPPAGYGFTLKDAGSDDTLDSDPDQATGITDAFALAAGANDDTRDAGLVQANTTTTKTGPTTATVGGQGTYTITVTNHGPTAAKNVVTTDLLPEGTTYVSSSNGCANANGTVTCMTASLGSNETVTYTVDVTFDTPGVKTNTGTTTSDTPDPNGNDNSSSTTTTVSDCSWLTISTAGTGSGSVSKTSSSSTFNCDDGNPVTADYETGTIVTLTATTDAGSTFTGWSGDCSGTSASCTLTMDADKSVVATFTLDNASISNYVWQDTDEDGIQDAGEPAYPGRDVELLDTTGATIAATTTDISGNYIFSGLAAGNYKVKFTPTTGWDFTLKDQGGDDTKDSDPNQATGITDLFALAAGANDTTRDAGLIPEATLSINDVSVTEGNSGTTTATLTVVLSRPSVHTVTVNFTTLFSSASPASDYVTTSGTLTFAPGTTTTTLSVLVTGDLDIESDELFLVQLSSPVHATFFPVVATGGVTILNDDQLVSDLVWLDTNGNGLQDDGATGVSGVTVQLLDGTTNAVLATTTTNVVGKYSFTTVSGSYKVKVTPPVNHGFTLKDASADDTIDSDVDPTAGANFGITDAFTLAAGADDDTRDAGLVQADTTTTKTGTSTTTVGGQITYTITVKNNGPTAAKNVTTTDVLPSGTTYVSSSNGCENSNGTVTCTSASLGNGETVTYTIGVTFDTPGVKTNTGTTTSDTPDPNGNDNSSSTTTTVSDCSWLTISTAGTGSGSVSKTSSSSTFNCDDGNPVTADYETGTIVTLTATADAGSTFTGWSGACTGTGTCTVTMDTDKSVTATFNRGTRNQGAGNVCPAGDRNGNLDLTGNCAIEGRVKGNIKIKDGTLTVLGTVEGNIEQEGVGSVIVTAEGTVKGNVKEQGDGDVEVSGVVDGNIEEEGSGNVVIQGTVTGNVKEKDAGSVEIGGTVQGNVEEEGAGNVTITASGVVHGNVTEKNAGTVTNGGSVIGNISQS